MIGWRYRASDRLSYLLHLLYQISEALWFEGLPAI